jgi:hypothetical protein
MRALSQRAASRCETATTKLCRCRCGGKLHGAKRHTEFDAWFFEGLPADDPHHVLTAEEKRLRAKVARVQREMRGQPQNYGLFCQPDGED